MVWIMPATHSSIVEAGSDGGEACASSIAGVGDGAADAVSLQVIFERIAIALRSEINQVFLVFAIMQSLGIAAEKL
jgi:hypothetical protein